MLHCQATGYPIPSLSWQKDGQAVDPSHVTVLSNGSLFISGTVVQDAGKFSCIASNVAGPVTAAADVVIYGKQNKIHIFTVNSRLVGTLLFGHLAIEDRS